MADVAITAGGQQPTPLDYTIPGAQVIAPKAANATFDGSGAAVPFVPTLQLVAPNGTILASCPVTDAVAAGASASVSWFPRGTVSKKSGGGTATAAFLIDFAASIVELAQDGVITGPPAQGFASATIVWKFLIGEYMRLSINNYDTVAHDFVGAVWVQDLESDTHEQVISNAVLTVGAGLAAPMGFAHAAQAAILSYANPFNPTVVLAASRYCFQVRVDVIG